MKVNNLYMLFLEFQNILNAIDEALFTFPGILLPVGGGLLSLFFVWFIIYASFRTDTLPVFVNDMLAAFSKSHVHFAHRGRFVKSWKIIQQHMRSDDSEKWRAAIHHADVMLARLIKVLDYGDGTTEEHLHKMQPSFFPYLEDAHRAHGVASYLKENPEYPIRRDVAEHTIGIYENIFREYDIL